MYGKIKLLSFADTLLRSLADKGKVKVLFFVDTLPIPLHELCLAGAFLYGTAPKELNFQMTRTYETPVLEKYYFRKYLF